MTIRTRNPTTEHVSEMAVRSGTQSVSRSLGGSAKSEERDVSCHLLPRRYSRLFYILLRERKRKGKKDITCTTKTNIGPRQISPSRPHPRRSSSCRRRHGEGAMRIFEITSRQTSSVSLLDKTYMKYGRSSCFRFLDFIRWNWNTRKALERPSLIWLWIKTF